MILGVADVRAALQKHAGGLLQDDEDSRQYLEGLLLDADSYDDLEALTEAMQSFLNDDRTTAEKLVKELAPKQKVCAPEAVANAPTIAPKRHVHHHTPSTSSGSEEEEGPGPLSPKSRAAQRKEKRLQRKQKNKQQPTGQDDIRQVVDRINTRNDQELNDLDDYSSAWEQVKQAAAEKGDSIVWGGRGCGGRGVNRGLGAYKGKDAVVHALTLSYGGRDLLHETHLAISRGHRYGLIGQNGVGKTTLLRRLAAGRVPGFPLHLSVAMVEQEVLGTPKSVLECMQEISQSGNQAHKKQALQQEIEGLEAILEETNTTPEDIEAATERLSEAYDQLDVLENSGDDNSAQKQSEKSSGFGKLDTRARKILKGLQFKQELLEIPGDTLSGGWRMRLALAQALYVEPDVLLLDEPTNHLDLSAVLFLENWLVDKDQTVVVVSHDGHFLDAICTDIIKFENCKLKYHVGNYTSFCEMEEQTWARNTSKAEAVVRKEKKTMEFIQKQRSMANSKHRDDNKQRQAAERQKKLGRIGLFSENGQKYKLLAEGNTKKGGSNRAGHIFGNYTNAAGFQSAFVSNEKHAFGEDKQLLNFKFPAAPPLKGGGGSFITVENGRFRYDNHRDWLLQDMSLNVSLCSRIAIVGRNGAGKSTLLKLLCGELALKGGEFHSHANLKIAHIAQHHIEHLGAFLELTPVEYFLQQHKAKNEQEARQFLGGFGLVGRLALQLIGTLSGGQKARLAFATVMFNAPHLLVLDEPTNHLDRDSLESLAAAVEKFEGAVITVSHNQDFMSRCAQEMWTVADGTVSVEVVEDSFDEAYARYKEGLRNEMKKRSR